MKPHKGTINNWKIVYVDTTLLENLETMDKDMRGSLGFYIYGTNPNPRHTWIRTSLVVKHEGNEVETLNSRYTLGIPRTEWLANSRRESHGESQHSDY